MEDRRGSVPENLPVGYRFHPYDEEVVNYYLKGKLVGTAEDGFNLDVIDLNEYDPRDLIAKFKHGSGDKEMYFFSPCKYHSNGSKRKRTAGGGWWKSTGVARPVTLDGTDNVIGTKRSLGFIHPDAPHFIINEYSYTAPLHSKSPGLTDKFVICKLKIKPSRKKMIIKKSKQVESECKDTPPKKKARKVDLLDSNKDSTTCNQHETSRQADRYFEKQNSVEKIDKSPKNDGKVKCHEPCDVGKCVADNKQTYVSIDGECKRWLMACKVGEMASKVESQCKNVEITDGPIMSDVLPHEGFKSRPIANNVEVMPSRIVENQRMDDLQLFIQGEALSESEINPQLPEDSEINDCEKSSAIFPSQSPFFPSAFLFSIFGKIDAPVLEDSQVFRIISSDVEEVTFSSNKHYFKWLEEFLELKTATSSQ